MKPADRQKMCPNCDGRVPYDATQCPFCFATLQTDTPTTFKNQSIQDSLTNYYTPPYGGSRSSPEPEDRSAKPMKSVEKEVPQPAPAAAAEAHDTRAFWPILLLTLAGNLFTLGVLQFFFSDDGIVKLEMSSGFWFLYVLISAPLFYLGLKQANRL